MRFLGRRHCYCTNQQGWVMGIVDIVSIVWADDIHILSSCFTEVDINVHSSEICLKPSCCFRNITLLFIRWDQVLCMIWWTKITLLLQNVLSDKLKIYVWDVAPFFILCIYSSKRRDNTGVSLQTLGTVFSVYRLEGVQSVPYMHNHIVLLILLMVVWHSVKTVWLAAAKPTS